VTSDFAVAQWFVEEARQLVRDGSPMNEIAVLCSKPVRDGEGHRNVISLIVFIPLPLRM